MRDMSPWGLVKYSIVSGIKKGLVSSISILKIMIPISFLVTVGNFLGIFNSLTEILSPVVALLGIQSRTLLAFLTGMFVNCWSAIAILITVPMAHKELVISSLMILFSHALPIELAIQSKAGADARFILLVRVFASVGVALLLNLCLPPDARATATSLTPERAKSIIVVLGIWATTSLKSILELVVIVTLFMVIHQYLEITEVLQKIAGKLGPLMRVLGLSEEVAVYWILVNIFGLIYGSSLVLSQDLKSRLPRTENTAFHLSIATCHALVQETIIFMVLGISALWLVLPRILFSLTSVWTYRFISGLSSRPAVRPKG